MQKDHSVAENIQMNIQLINFNILLGLSLTSICPTNDIKFVLMYNRILRTGTDFVKIKRAHGRITVLFIRRQDKQ